MSSSNQPLMVIGAGIAGITTSLEAAEAGREVILVEREPSVGGRVLRNHNYFPKMCPPSCGMEINTRRMEKNPRLRVLVNATVAKAESVGSGWKVTVKKAPEYVKASCTACGECSKVCPAKVKDSFNMDLAEVPAVRMPHADAWPRLYTLDRKACPSGCKKCVEACAFKAIDLDAKETEETFQVGSMVVATGWKPYPKKNLVELGGDVLEDVVSNVELERMAASAGPTAGKILRPSNKEAPKKVAFVQCAGSRDHNHLPYCSAVCCLASLKQAIYVREQIPESEVTIYYIDRRTPGRNEDMLTRVAGMDGVKLVKGKVGKIEKVGGALKLRVEDVENNKLLEEDADLVVLATGMQPNVTDGIGFDLSVDGDGFVVDDVQKGLFAAGVARRPEDVAASVRDATGAAAKAIIASAAVGRSA
ncbi:MAG: hypothetical protein A2289_02750 [Deltaproteobacteria bacterium RIFOXYA12_FULL_58_15]|nr:MAG: hypothetical protein A2289_02750 [Deltaproteobacteria bacterium RIFOXYA12_FULL_58_15]OGR13367.1 MAG: hypothetical protein A2341_16075 [Deltaproteobacteria bacterium RIFOXYB12_FULL_58_9]